MRNRVIFQECAILNFLVFGEILAKLSFPVFFCIISDRTTLPLQF